MAQLIWDQPGDRRYELGLDRGVLFTDDGTAVVWNGLTSLSEADAGGEVVSYYMDGVKFLDSRSSSDFAATLKAFTYPDEFAKYDGYVVTDDGVTIPNQPVNSYFGLSYRTFVGNDQDPNAGYRIHFLYNLTAKPTGLDYGTREAAPKPLEFSWDLSGVPVYFDGYRPIVHLFVDSSDVEDYQLAALESYLYGDDDVDPVLPSPDDITSIIQTAPAPAFLFDGGDPIADASEIVFDGGGP